MGGLLRADGGSGAWLVSLVHGSFRQCSLSLKARPGHAYLSNTVTYAHSRNSRNLQGRSLTLTVLARRSRLFAGARLLKRGLCAAGHVANEVETEQICADGSRGALHSGGLSSDVQLRGSIPLVWGHGEQSRVVPRPDIHVQARSARDRPEIT